MLCCINYQPLGRLNKFTVGVGYLLGAGILMQETCPDLLWGPPCLVSRDSPILVSSTYQGNGDDGSWNCVFTPECLQFYVHVVYLFSLRDKCAWAQRQFCVVTLQDILAVFLNNNFTCSGVKLGKDKVVRISK